MAQIVGIYSSTNRMKTLAHTPVAAVTVDDVVVINTRVCIAYADVAASAEGQFIYQADEVEVNKAAVAITAGDIAYWDPSAELFTNVDGGGANTKCGVFREAAASGDATANMELDNSIAL